MPVPPSPIPEMGSFAWLVLVAVASFLVSWLVATTWRVARTTYVAVLVSVALVLWVGYVAWAGLDEWSQVTTNWGWSIVGGLVTGAVTGFAISRMPATLRRTGTAEGVALAWEGVVYGVAEGLLLSALPALIAWQLIQSLAWDGLAGDVGAWLVPLTASVVVIVVHHLGYHDYRNRLLVPITIACGLLTLAYLVTGSVLAPVLGHVLMHAAAIVHGTELPPHQRPALQATGPLVPVNR